MSRRVLVVCAALLLAMPCLAGNDQDFRALVTAIESQYGVRHMRIPMLGFATLCLRIAGTPGLAGLKIAVFQDIRRSDQITSESLQESIESAVGGHWKPLVRVRSRDDGESTMIYANPNDKELQVLIVSLEHDNATVVQAHVKPSQILKWMNDPDDAEDLHGTFSMDVN